MENQNLQSLKKNKKGQLDTLLTGFVIIAAVLVLLVLLIFVFGTVNEGLESTAVSNSVVNESGGYINTTGYQLADGITGEPRTFSVTTVHNASDGAVITSGNYTISSGGLVTNASATTWDDVNITYTYYNNSISQVAARDAQTNTTRAIPIVGILFIILAVGALITILLISLAGKRRS